MKLEKIVPLAELVSSIAVVITLIYLTIQTQQTNAALLASSRQATLATDITFITTLVENPEVMVNMNRPMTELTPGERDQAGNAFAAIMRTREFAWLQYRDGTLDEATFESYMETLLRWIRDYEASADAWRRLAAGVNPEFRGYVNARLADHPGSKGSE